ncbi:nitrogen regulation protein NR(II) [Bordetella sp. LUAb4]|uniref:two-component system sensor histidine kinase NtrB n=1 Tax=Bordetella sp. LUAb4 TaxID=2843195 RepID=UPI001E2ED7DB|nr:ATP-binding protein [Bordetella sp. LUAb4]
MLPADNAAVTSKSFRRDSETTDYKKWHEHTLGARSSFAHVVHDGERLHAILELLPYATVLVNSSGAIVLANPAAAALFGYAQNALIGLAVDILIPVLACGIPPHRETSAEEKSKKPITERAADTLARRRDGTEFPAGITVRPLQSDPASEILITIVDQTEHAELCANRSALAHLTRASTLGQLAGSLAHELNQPLTAIRSNSQAAQRLIAASPLDMAELREILMDLVKDNQRASEVLRKIRLLVKQGHPELAPLNLTAVIDDVALLLRTDAIIRGVRLSLNIAADLPSVAGDKVQLQQVILNLVLNAFEAVATRSAPDREVVIEAATAGANMVRVAVRDQGCGLTGDALDEIFKPYFTTKREGLGLGLCISRSITEAHGGHIWAEHNKDRGASILFTIPIATTPRPQE